MKRKFVAAGRRAGAAVKRSTEEQKARRRRLTAVLACATGALFLVGVAGAANSSSFTDRAGDAGVTPDITRIDVSNDDAGTITFVVTYTGLPLGLPGEEFGLALDLDQNPDTGSVYYGTESAIAFEEGTLTFFRATTAGSFAAATPPTSLRGSVGQNTATISVKAGELGIATDGGFNLAGFSHSLVGATDTAPEVRTFNYQLGGNPPPPLGPDRRPPLDQAFASRGVHGKVAHLDDWTADGRGTTADTIRVYRRTRLLRTIRVPLGDANPFFSYYAPWRVPRNVRGRLRFCVRSVDAAGNKSIMSCARLVIR